MHVAVVAVLVFCMLVADVRVHGASMFMLVRVAPIVVDSNTLFPLRTLTVLTTPSITRTSVASSIQSRMAHEPDVPR